jgi:hypothetical protein
MASRRHPGTVGWTIRSAFVRCRDRPERLDQADRHRLREKPSTSPASDPAPLLGRHADARRHLWQGLDRAPGTPADDHEPAARGVARLGRPTGS